MSIIYKNLVSVSVAKLKRKNQIRMSFEYLISMGVSITQRKTQIHVYFISKFNGYFPQLEVKLKFISILRLS